MNEQKNETNRYSIPEPVRKLMTFLPSWPGSLLFVSALNAVLKPRLPADVGEAIAGKQLRLTMTDAHLDFNFVWTKICCRMGKRRTGVDDFRQCL